MFYMAKIAQGARSFKPIVQRSGGISRGCDEELPAPYGGKDVVAVEGAGLSIPHTSPRVRAEAQAPHGEIISYPGAPLVKVRLRNVYRGRRQPPPVGQRGTINRFSAESARRLVAKCQRLREAAINEQKRGLWFTLTFPDSYEWTPERVKAALDAFAKRCARAGIGFVWKVEFKRRKSGNHVGEHYPHFHCIGVQAGEVKPVNELREWIGQVWFEVCGTNDPKHRAAGTKVDRLESMGGVAHYAAKYASKGVDDPDFDAATVGWDGRWWGVKNAKLMPFAEEVEEWVSVEEATELIDHHAEQIGIRDRYLAGVSVYKARSTFQAERARVIALWHRRVSEGRTEREVGHYRTG